MARVRGGTLLIDEIADIDDEIQARIVRMMDTPGDHVPRFMATSQSDLTAGMEGGRIRQDLYYRLCGATIHVPALRERVDDITLLAEHFLAREEKDLGSKRWLSADAVELVRRYSWPGNVRQLENAIRRLSLTSRSDEISKAEVEMVLGSQPEAEPVLGGGEREKLATSVERHLRRYFDLHGNMLPPPGLYQRILREVEAPVDRNRTGSHRRKPGKMRGFTWD